jgi:YVTN family beta-propeller protein
VIAVAVWRKVALVLLIGLSGLGAFVATSTVSAAAAAAGCTGTVYVANFGAGTVSVIDTKTGKVTDSITVGKAPYGIVFSPDGTRAYVTNHFGNTVSVINTKTRTVTATIPVGIDPWSIAITPDGKHVYTANDGGPSDPTVSVITTKTRKVATITGAAGANAVAVRPDGKQAYVVSGLGIVMVIDTKTGALVSTPSGTPAPSSFPGGIKLGAFNAEEIRFSPDGRRAYITTNADGSLVVVDTKTRSVTSTIKVGRGAIGLSITPDGKHAWVGTEGALVVVDTATGVTAAPIAVGAGDQAVAIAPDGKHAYVAGGAKGPAASRLSVIDTKTKAVSGTIDVGSLPMGVAICSPRNTHRRG